MLSIDGSVGEGGGQILRSALTLSMVAGVPFTIERIRGRRRKPGLLRQHLTAVRASQEICGARVVGAELGADRLTFEPNAVRGGEYRFAIGSAGSTTLVFQTVMPALALADAPSQLQLEGGTHNPSAPPFDFLEVAYLPLIERMGPTFQTTLERHGFAPAGGGCWTVDIDPVSSFERLDLEQPATGDPFARILFSGLPGSIAARERKHLLKLTRWQPERVAIESIDASGPGNIVLIHMPGTCGAGSQATASELFSAAGRRGLRAEKVVKSAIDAMRRYQASGGAVGEHLADQLMLPMALSATKPGGGGSFTTAALSQHATTQLDLIRRFLEVEVSVDEFSIEQAESMVRVEIL